MNRIISEIKWNDLSQTEKWIIDQLSNNEWDSDEELVGWFIEEGGLTKAEAEKWIAKRSYYSNNIVIFPDMTD